MSLFTDHKTYKSALFEFYQQIGVPSNQLIFSVGMLGLHTSAQRFTCTLRMPTFRQLQPQIVSGHGKSKKEAEHAAAGEALRVLANAGYIPTQGLFMAGLVTDPAVATQSKLLEQDLADSSQHPRSTSHDTNVPAKGSHRSCTPSLATPYEHAGGSTTGGVSLGEMRGLQISATQDSSVSLQPDSPASTVQIGSDKFEEKMRNIDLPEAKELVRKAHAEIRELKLTIAKHEQRIFELYDDRKEANDRLQQAISLLQATMYNLDLDKLNQTLGR